MGRIIKTTSSRLIARNSIFVWIAFAVGVLLLIPLAVMQLTTAVIWSASDFVVMGVLLFVTGSIFVLVARKTSFKHRLASCILIIAAFFYVWAELAVGVFTNLGS